MGKTNIEWATHTWNPYGWHCTPVSSGCKNCYARAMTERFNRGNFADPPEWRGESAIKEWNKLPAGAVVFVNSMSDTFHEDVPLETVQMLFDLIASRPDVTALVLTKRIVRAYIVHKELNWAPNLWIGTSVESALRAVRAEHLVDIPAAGRFISFEPLLGPIIGDPMSEGLLRLASEGLIHWFIVGAESGDQRRHFDLKWARDLKDFAQLHRIPFMFKQGSHRFPGKDRLLDGQTWDESPFNKE